MLTGVNSFNAQCNPLSGCYYHPLCTHGAQRSYEAGSGHSASKRSGEGFSPRSVNLDPVLWHHGSFLTSSFSGEQGRLWHQTQADLGFNCVTVGRCLISLDLRLFFCKMG